jgi:formate dehydrogenase assembly factor FdhD
MTTVRQGCPKTGMRIASTFETTTPVHIERNEANARLIAAAPELLEAAILGLSISESWINERYSGERYEKANEALNPIRAAITKARGKA